MVGTFSGSAANIALGSNFLSGDGDDEGVFVSDANITLAIGNELEFFELEEKDYYYSILLKTDNLDKGNYSFIIAAEKSGFRDFVSSAFAFEIVVKYPFTTAILHPEYWSEIREDPISLILDPTLYIMPILTVTLITLQITTFAAIDPRKLRSLYIFTHEGKGLHYRAFYEEEGIVDSQLMSAALSGIVKLVMEATSSEKPLQTIDLQTFEIFLEHGRFVTIAAFVGKRIFYRRKIRRGQKKLINNIERKYSSILRNWDGDLNPFYEMNQLVFDAFDFKPTEDLVKLIHSAADVQMDLVSSYSAQRKFHKSGRSLWKAYDLYSKIKNPSTPKILARWIALEKGLILEHISPKTELRTKIIKLLFSSLDFVRTPSLLKVLHKIRDAFFIESEE